MQGGKDAIGVFEIPFLSQADYIDLIRFILLTLTKFRRLSHVIDWPELNRGWRNTEPGRRFDRGRKLACIASPAIVVFLQLSPHVVFHRFQVSEGHPCSRLGITWQQ